MSIFTKKRTNCKQRRKKTNNTQHQTTNNDRQQTKQTMTNKKNINKRQKHQMTNKKQRQTINTNDHLEGPTKTMNLCSKCMPIIKVKNNLERVSLFPFPNAMISSLREPVKNYLADFSAKGGGASHYANLRVPP